MHSCFRIPEVTLELVSHLNPAIADDRATLKALAVTCKSVSEPSLNLLWEIIPIVSWLLRMMPSDCWTDGVFPWDREEPELLILRPLVASDFERVLFYSRRVRRIADITTANFRAEEISFHDGVDTMSPILSSFNLFPKLREVGLLANGDAPNPLHYALLVPHLQTFAWVLKETEAPQSRSLLAKLTTTCTAITSLLFNVYYDVPSYFMCCMVQYLPRFTALVELDITITSANLSLFLNNLEHLTHVQTLMLNEHENKHNSSEPSRIESKPNSCPPVRDLQMVDCSREAISAVLRAIGKTHLERLSISLDKRYRINFFEVVPLLAGEFRLLEEITIDDWFGPPVLHRDSAVSSDCLQPLTNLTKLRHIHLTPADSCFALKPGALAELTQAWPLLEYFHLSNHLSTPYAPMPDMGNPKTQEMVAFVNNCPRLTDVSVSLDATTFSEADIEALKGSNALIARPHPVHISVNPWYSILQNEDDADLVARWLTTLFGSMDLEDDDGECPWTRVQELCEEIQSRRPSSATLAGHD